MIIYFDTETTGLHPGQICQLSYIMQNQNGTQAKNLFFTVDYVEPSALAVHGFSVQKLSKLSGGKTFANCFAQVYNDFALADAIVSHNVNFDMSFMRAEFERLGQTLPDYKTFCSMKNAVDICKLKRKSGGYKYPKLSELCAFLGISDAQIISRCKQLFDSNAGYHDARFDATALYMAVNCAMQKQEKFKQLIQFI